MRVAVVMYGMLRCFEHTAPFFKRHLDNSRDLIGSGVEFEILKHVVSSNISRAFPAAIRYEYMWIQEKAECDRLLNFHGYRIDYCKFDPTYNKITHSRSS